MYERGTVISKNGEWVNIKIAARGACEKCRACITLNEREMVIMARDEVGVEEGDRVILRVSPGKVVQAALVVYLIPIILLFAGYFLGFLLQRKIPALGAGEGFPIAVAFLLFICSLGVLKLFDLAARREDRGFRAIVTKKASE